MSHPNSSGTKALTLEDHLSSTLLPDAVDALQSDGYYVVPEPTLSPHEERLAMVKLWSYVTTTSPTQNLTHYHPSTAFSQNAWPSSSWASFPDMFQSNGAGWLFSDERTFLHDRLFCPLFSNADCNSRSLWDFFSKILTQNLGGSVRREP